MTPDTRNRGDKHKVKVAGIWFTYVGEGRVNTGTRIQCSSVNVCAKVRSAMGKREPVCVTRFWQIYFELPGSFCLFCVAVARLFQPKEK